MPDAAAAAHLCAPPLRSHEGTSPMKLYMFEHCSLCFRVRMIAALKRLHLKEVVVLDRRLGSQ
jgi:hypothetical protein